MSKFEENVMKLLAEISQRQIDFQKEVNNRFDNVSKQFDGVSKQFDDVNKQFDDVNKQFDDVNKQFDNVNKRFDKIESDIEKVKEENHLIKRAVMETNESVKIILEDQKSIYEMLGEHEISIRTLRRKPV